MDGGNGTSRSNKKIYDGLDSSIEWIKLQDKSLVCPVKKCVYSTSVRSGLVRHLQRIHTFGDDQVTHIFKIRNCRRHLKLTPKSKKVVPKDDTTVLSNPTHENSSESLSSKSKHRKSMKPMSSLHHNKKTLQIKKESKSVDTSLCTTTNIDDKSICSASFSSGDDQPLVIKDNNECDDGSSHQSQSQSASSYVSNKVETAKKATTSSTVTHKNKTRFNCNQVSKEIKDKILRHNKCKRKISEICDNLLNDQNILQQQSLNTSIYNETRSSKSAKKTPVDVIAKKLEIFTDNNNIQKNNTGNSHCKNNQSNKDPGNNIPLQSSHSFRNKETDKSESSNCRNKLFNSLTNSSMCIPCMTSIPKDVLKEMGSNVVKSEKLESLSTMKELDSIVISDDTDEEDDSGVFENVVISSPRTIRSTDESSNDKSELSSTNKRSIDVTLTHTTPFLTNHGVHIEESEILFVKNPLLKTYSSEKLPRKEIKYNPHENVLDQHPICSTNISDNNMKKNGNNGGSVVISIKKKSSKLKHKQSQCDSKSSNNENKLQYTTVQNVEELKEKCLANSESSVPIVNSTKLQVKQQERNKISKTVYPNKKSKCSNNKSKQWLPKAESMSLQQIHSNFPQVSFEPISAKDIHKSQHRTLSGDIKSKSSKQTSDTTNNSTGTSILMRLAKIRKVNTSLKSSDKLVMAYLKDARKNASSHTNISEHSSHKENDSNMSSVTCKTSPNAEQKMSNKYINSDKIPHTLESNSATNIDDHISNGILCNDTNKQRQSPLLSTKTCSEKTDAAIGGLVTNDSQIHLFSKSKDLLQSHSESHRIVLPDQPIVTKSPITLNKQASSSSIIEDEITCANNYVATSSVDDTLDKKSELTVAASTSTDKDSNSALESVSEDGLFFKVLLPMISKLPEKSKADLKYKIFQLVHETQMKELYD